MNWDNLKTQNCPYCGNHLVDTGPEMKCKHCKFHIDHVKCAAIVKSRSGEGESKMKWQNIIEEKCPICGEMLREGEGHHEKLRCTDGRCTFKISNAMLRQILDDPTHPANRFYELDQEVENYEKSN